jgi:hypothetical protein
MDTKCPNQVFYVLLFDQQTIIVQNRSWRRDPLQIRLFVIICPTWSKVQQKLSFESWIPRNDVNGVYLFLLSYVITVMAYLCSQWTPNIQIKYLMFRWSIYRLLVLSRGRIRECLQIIIFVYVCSTWSIVELKHVLRRE